MAAYFVCLPRQPRPTPHPDAKSTDYCSAQEAQFRGDDHHRSKRIGPIQFPTDGRVMYGWPPKRTPSQSRRLSLAHPDAAQDDGHSAPDACLHELENLGSFYGMALYIEKREQRSLTTATSGSPRFDLRMVAELGLKDLVNPPEIPFPFRRIR